MPKTKSRFMIQKHVDNVWKDLDQYDELENSAEALKLIKEEKLVGDFRIISIRSFVSTAEKTVLDVHVEGISSDDD